MFTIANIINTRNTRIDRLFHRLEASGWDPESLPANELRELVGRCVRAGANGIEINIQQHQLPPQAMATAVEIVQQVTDLPLFLSTNSAESLEAGLRQSRRFAVANYISLEEMRLREMLPVIARYGAQVILLATDPARLQDAREMVKKAAVLVGAANEIGIPNDRIFIDPGLLHVTSPQGQEHLEEVMEFLRALPDAFDPPVRSTCWLSNASAGVPARLRPLVETSLLAMLVGIDLSSVFLDVLSREHMRMLRLVRIFRNEAIYAEADLSLLRPVT